MLVALIVYSNLLRCWQYSFFRIFTNTLYCLNVGETSIFCGSIVGSCLGFLWYNAPPAKIFMGDTGSLSLGGSLGAVSIISKARNCFRNYRRFVCT